MYNYQTLLFHFHITSKICYTNYYNYTIKEKILLMLVLFYEEIFTIYSYHIRFYHLIGFHGGKNRRLGLAEYDAFRLL